MADDAPLPTQTLTLLRRYKDGDGEALERLVALHYPRVERMVRARMGPMLLERVEVADVVQGAMLRAVQELDSFEPREDARLVHWLAQFAEHEVRNAARHYRAQKRDAGRERALEALRQSAGQSTFGWDAAAESTAVPDKVSRAELEEIVDACLNELEADWREVILLRDYAGASWAFVAEEMGRASADAARMLHQRARAELAERVRRRL